VQLRTPAGARPAVSSRARRASWPVACALVLAALTLSPAGASAAELNVTGSWQGVYHCSVGSCSGQNISATVTLNQATGSTVVTGQLTGTSANGEELNGAITGSLVGHTLTLEGKGTKKLYTAKGTETISEDGLSWTGTYEDSANTSGTFTAVREAPPAETAGTRPSAIEVLCTLEVASGDFTCTAQVGDAGTTGTSTVPTGTVKFLAIGGRGAFTPTETCLLSQTPGSSDVASCSVTYVPPTGGIPVNAPVPVSGTYSGSTTFASSTAQAGAGPNISPSVSVSASATESATTTVGCPAGVVSCPVTVAVTVVEEGKAVSAKVKRKTVTIGSKSVRIPGGKKAKITVTLNAAGKRLLAKHKHLTALLTVSSHGKVIKKQKVQIKQRHKG
jgi:hypothetical protein